MPRPDPDETAVMDLEVLEAIRATKCITCRRRPHAPGDEQCVTCREECFVRPPQAHKVRLKPKGGSWRWVEEETFSRMLEGDWNRG